MKNIFGKIGSVKFTLIASIMCVAFISQIISGVAQYISCADSARTELHKINEASMRPIAGLAAIAVNGGNKMLLSNKEAKSLYESSKLLFVRISGMSAGAAATSYSDAIAPQQITYEYSNPEASALSGKIENAIRSGKSGLIEEDMLYILRIPLNIPNKGEVIAAFSAENLRGLEWRVFSDVALTGFVVLFASLFLAVYLGRRIAGPTEDIANQINAITQKLDFSARVTTANKHEIGRIADSFNSLLSNLQPLLRDMAVSADQIFASSNQLTGASVRIAEGAEGQAKRSSDAAASIEELSESIRHVAENADGASKASGNVSDAAKRGETVVRDAATEMKKIADSVNKTKEQILSLDEGSREISGIISLIREIADQTNLLALNAAIEAARAGEQGRGFAVVADEVRKLAERTGKATGEIAGKIDANREETANAVSGMQENVALVERGVQLAEQAGESLATINTGVQSMAGMIRDIAAATQEQMSSSKEVSRNIEFIARTSDEYEAIVGETRSATQSLEQQAANLKKMAERFEI